MVVNFFIVTRNNEDDEILGWLGVCSGGGSGGGVHRRQIGVLFGSESSDLMSIYMESWEYTCHVRGNIHRHTQAIAH